MIGTRLLLIFICLYGRVCLSLDVSLIGNREVQIFSKCYHQFTRSPLPSNHDYLASIKNQSKTGAELCIAFLEQISFSNGELSEITMESQQTLKTFNDLHRSWFPDQSFHAVETQRSLGDFYDSGEPAYFYTRSLFDPNYTDPRKILSGKKRLHAIRVDETDNTFDRSKYYLHEPRALASTGGGKIMSRLLPFGAVTCDPDNLKELNKNYSDFYKTPSTELATTIRDKKDIVDKNNCVKGPLIDELGVSAVNDLGFINGFEEREILLNEDHYIYSSNFKGHHYQGELRNTKIIAEYFPLFKYIHHDQVCDEPFFNDDDDAVYLPIKLNRCKDMFSVSSNQKQLGDPKINIVNPNLETFPYTGEDDDYYLFPKDGLNSYSAFNIPKDKSIFNAGITQWDLSGNIDTGTSREGAGALGSMSYFILNSNNTIAYYDGYFTVNRRWAQHAISDFLCRDIPVLSAADIVNNTEIMSAQLESAAPGFRGEVSCMTCHVTMDLAARTTRNVKLHPMTGGDKGPKDNNAEYEKPALYHQPNIAMTDQDIKNRITHSSVLQGVEDIEHTHSTYFWENKIPYYTNSTPKGAFVFKDFMEGAFINEPVTGVSELADQFLETNDFYGCIAKRYLSYLTGYEVILAPPDPLIDEYKSEQQKQLEDFHRYLTVFLKTGEQENGETDPQTMKGLINKILRSEFFYEEISNE